MKTLQMLIILLFCVTCTLGSNSTGNYTTNQLELIQKMIYDVEYQQWYDPALGIWDAIRKRVDPTNDFYSVLVFSNQTNDATFYISPFYIVDNHYLVWTKSGNRQYTYILWKSTLKADGVFSPSQYQFPNQQFNYMSRIVIQQIKVTISEAIVRKGNDIHENAVYIGQTLQQLNQGVWIVVITQGVPKMRNQAYIMMGSDIRQWAYINNYERLNWNYFFIRIL